MISINLSELIWTIINFFLLMFLLKRFLYTPILRFMAARQARVDAGLEAERSAQAQVQENDRRLADEKAASRGEAKRILNTPRQENDCKTADSIPSPYLLDGMFVIDNLLHAIRETGFEITYFRDRTKQLQDWYAQLLMDYGSLDEYWKQTLPDGSKPFCRAKVDKHTGYFLLTAEKL